MRPGTIFNWIDQSGIQREVPQATIMPTFLTAFSSDRGPEDINIISGEDFYKLYGYDISFAKHGQPLLQAANIIDNGGELMCKRVVAPDATLANIVIVAKVEAKSTQKKNADGELLYKNPTSGEETTEAEDNDPIMLNSAQITYETQTVSNTKGLPEMITAAESNIDTTGSNGVFTYPLFVIADNGRGKSTKRFNISPDYQLSKNLGFMLYHISVIGEHDKDTETTRFCLDEDKVYLNESMSFTEKVEQLVQITGASIPEAVKAFVDKVANITGVATTNLYMDDILFGRTRKGVSVDYITFGENTIELNNAGGFELKSGVNGTFGDAPFGSDDYKTELVNFFSGKFTDSIFDVDRYKPDACLDANYPVTVKNAIVSLVNFREDFFFFRDLGLDNYTKDTILYAAAELPKTKFVADYIQTYSISDPFTRKRVQVTFTYGLARTLISHLNDRRNAPVCGIVNGMTFPEALEGTINFCPKYTPTEDQKEQLDDLHLNYASYLNGVLTLESEYTTQEDFTQLSYINNIIAIQSVIRDVRNRCPAFRYQFITNDDLETYRSNVENVILQHSDKFETLEFLYTQDAVMAQNKIFQASIRCKFKNFAQTEIFNIYALA
ncbi:MAG: hypothetical protein PHC62_00200 [Candidatus Izemoplasmatales bacterium]|nr:hypothetical protein [Candidatus Izemoplasmatales bacterium]